MSDPTWALQKAIYAALDAALAIPVHDMGAIPAGAAMPYVAIGPIQASGDDRLATLADRTLVYLTAWTDYGGQKQALEYVATIYGALHRARLTLETGRLVRAYVVRRGTEADLSDEIFKGTVSVLCHVEH